MRIIVEYIDKNSFELRGYTPTPSFKVQFSSKVFAGVARLIPYSGAPDAVSGAQFDVELNQEAVTGFRMCDVRHPCVDPLVNLGDFKVRGIVHHVAFHSEPPGNHLTYVNVLEAVFMLGAEDTGAFRPAIGSGVEFIAHDLSMWDEAL